MKALRSRGHRSQEEGGFALIAVIGFVAIITALVFVGAAMADRSLRSSTQHIGFEGSLAAAEDGIDKALARGQLAYQRTGSDSWVTPGPSTTFDASPECPGSSIAWPYSSPPTAATEKSWARTNILSLVGTTGCLRHAPLGDFVILKPTGHQAVYAMGWSPKYGAPNAKSRLLKAEYIFAPYAPNNAILTGGDLELDASTKVSTAGESCPLSPANQVYRAGVHSNGAITVPNGNPIVCGPVSASTSSSGSSSKFYDTTNNAASGAIPATPKQSIASVTASEVWSINHATSPPGGWYDLCADGTVHAPDAAAPCAVGSTVLADVNAGGSYRGWSFTSGTVPTWHAGSGLMTSGYSGTYYVNGGDIVNDASNVGTSVPNLTVIAAASTLSCNKVGGNIRWDHTDIVAPSLHSTFMMADQDLLTTSNFEAGGISGGTVVSGFFIAGDQVQMETSANGAYGAVIALDACDPPDGSSLVDKDIIKNPSIFYDPNAQAPFIDIINTTLWLEY